MKTATIARGARKAYASATTGVTGALISQATRGRSVDLAGDLGGSAFGSIAARVGDGMLTAVDFAIGQFATNAAVRADVTRVIRQGMDERALERQLIRDHAWRNGAVGAVSGIPAMIPVAGTGIELAAAIADQAVLTVAEARMILGLAHLRGLDVQDTDRRRLDILIILGLASGAGEIREDEGIIAIAGQELSVDYLRDVAMPRDTVVALCSAIGTDIVRRVAKRRTAGMLLRLMPGGVSVVVAAVSDWKLTGVVGKQAIAYYDVLAPAQNPTGPARI